MFRTTVLSLVAAGALVSCAPAARSPAASMQAPVPLAGELVATLDSIVLAAAVDGGVAGIVVAVGSAHGVTYTRAHGHAVVEPASPVTDSTIFRIGSIAKQMTAAAVLRLEAQGLLTLDTPMSDLVAEYPPQWAGVTVYHLLTHTSGVPSYTSREEFWSRATEVLPLRERIDFVRALPLQFTPGTAWEYSNTGYLLLGQLVETLSGRGFGEFVEMELLRPLGLRDTGVCVDDHPRMASGYTRTETGYRKAVSNQLGGTFGDGDLCSSARDLLRWSSALSRGEVVGSDGYRRITTRGRLTDGQAIHYGLGVDLMELEGVGTVVEHGGGVPGFRSHLAHYPEQQVTIVVLTNTFEPVAHDTKRSIERALFAALLPEVQNLPLPAGREAIYAGRFDLYLRPQNMGPFPIRIFIDEGAVMMEAEGTVMPLLWQGGHDFVDGAGAGLSFSFEVHDGRAIRLVMKRSGLSFSGDRSDAPHGYQSDP